ncbi:MAG: heparinase II/III family protein [Bryobacterales bacterium]|nr:heparinase II/III family protein [Bryobacterales bacterium]
MRSALLTLLPYVASAAVFPPHLDRIDLPRLIAETAPVRAMSEAELRKLVPRQSGLFYVGCPNCNGGNQERQLAWSPDRPAELYCRYCNHRYPSAKYPMDKSVEVQNPRGETQKYPYWENASGYRYFFAAKRDDLIREYLATQTRNLALLYLKTSDRSYAQRAASLLTEFAAVFPGWTYHYDYPFQQKRIFSGAKPSDPAVQPMRMARWTWWVYNDMPEPLLEAWDWIRDAGVIDRASAERIERDLFRNAADEMISGPETNSNMSPRLWRSLVKVGRITGERRYIDEPLVRLKKFIEDKFYYDGSWSEGAPSYAAQTIGGLRAVLRDRGVDTNPPELQRADRAFAKLHFPDGRRVTVHDTWWTDHDTPLPESRPFLLPALGHAALAGAAPAHQWQAHLTWAGGYGHQHADRLSIILWARGRELLSDLGYSHTRYRPWTLATVAHNTVVIDELNQEMKEADGALRFFDASHPRVQVVSADGDRAYPGVAKRYRRTLVTVDAKYLVDQFEVEGGTTHDYFLHGDADRNGDVTLPGASQPVPEQQGWTPTENEGEINRIREQGYAYGFLQSQREMRPGKTGFLTIGMPEHLRIHFLAEPDDRLYAGKNPAVRGARDDDSKLGDFMRGFFRARRQGGRSVFLSVIELTPGAVKKVERTRTGVRVDGTDIIINENSIRVPSAGYSLAEPHRAPLQSIGADGITVDAARQPAKGTLVKLITSDGWVYPLIDDGFDAFSWDSAAKTLRLTRFPTRSHTGDVTAEWR